MLNNEKIEKKLFILFKILNFTKKNLNEDLEVKSFKN